MSFKLLYLIPNMDDESEAMKLKSLLPDPLPEDYVVPPSHGIVEQIVTQEEYMAARFKEAIPTILSKREAIGRQVIREMASRNQIEGITSAQADHMIGRSKNILFALNFGFLTDAKNFLSDLVPDDMSQPEHWITQERIDYMCERINYYLEV